MKVIQIYEYGAVDVLNTENISVPQPGNGHVLVKLFASAVNPADWKIRAGLYQKNMPVTLPWTPGMEGAGVVESVGEGVSDYRPGQAVFGLITRSNAEFALVSASDIQPKPENLTFEQAASVSVGALTAWAEVVTAGDVQPGQRVLVHGGAGGVGLFAVQLAHWKGAQVLATTSVDNLQFVQSLGADEVIDYRKAPFETVVKDVDVVIDTVGGDMPERSLKVIRPGGRFITIAGKIPPEYGRNEGVSGVFTGWAKVETLKRIVELLESGVLRPEVGMVYPLAEVRQAHIESQTGHGRGRIVLKIAE